ncbi:MAG TPA: acyltransferase [Silvibacterium sp.]|nr:acyltransferase [Silvibacterium sp.]
MSADSPRGRIGFDDPLQLIPRVLTKLYTLWVRATHPFASLGQGVSIHYTCDLHNTGLMSLGNVITVHKDTWLHAHPSPANESRPALIIGDHCFIARRCHISAANHIHIEENVLFAASVLVQDRGHSYADITRPIKEQEYASGGTIRIGAGTWIGHGAAIICDGGELTIGRNCVIAANAVVTRSAPAYSVLSGNPARIVKQFDPAKGTWVLGSVRTETAKPQEAPIAGAPEPTPTLARNLDDKSAEVSR